MSVPLPISVGRTDLHSPQHSDPPNAEEVPQQVVVATGTSDARTELVRLCVREGYQPTPVSTPDALLKGLLGSVDLALFLLEDPDTVELCGELRQMDAYRNAAILVVTRGPPQPEQAAAVLLAGADDFCSLSERWRPELRARLRVHLRNKRYRDAVARLRSERDDLRSRVATDSLTGTLGRRALVDAVSKQLSGGQGFAVLFADIDHFKRVNDTFGHQMGDWALQRVAEALSGGRRQGDVCARYGGEEFVLVVCQVDGLQAHRIAERHRASVARLRLAQDGGPERITISVGVAVFEPEVPDASVESLLARADAALYRAKNAGRDCVMMAEPCLLGASSQTTAGLRTGAAGGAIAARHTAAPSRPMEGT